MKKYIIVFSILNFITTTLEGVINSNQIYSKDPFNGVSTEISDEFTSAKEFIDINLNNETEYKVNSDSRGGKNSNPGVKYYQNLYPTYEYSQEGIACNNLNENSSCPFRFKTMGPVTYNGNTECYFHFPRAGPNDRLEFIEGTPRNMFVDLNAELKCYVRGKEYHTMQRVNIQVSGVYNNGDKYTYRSFPRFTKLNFGKNHIIDGTTTYDITIGNCESVWTYRNRRINKNNCRIDWVGYSADKCGTYNGISYICASGCCGANGRCGSSSAYCGTGCQAFFGNCGSVTANNPIVNSNSYSSKLSKSSSSSSNMSNTSSDGRCGSYNGKNCHTGYCCSQYGYCGKSKDHCGYGCQTKFGKCY